jgi:tetratricopeptide (TPR) repeat protein
MSPEQALARHGLVDHRADVYALGATLYELLTLQPAFPGNDRQELLRQIAFEEPRPPRRLNTEVSAELETITLKALEKSPADRYPTARELADDLRRFLEDKPIRARRPTLYQRLTKWGRRHKGVVATGVAALVLAMVLLALSTTWVWKENQAKNAALVLADQRHRKAMEAVERMLARVADERMAAIPQMKEIRESLLDDAVALYTELVALNPNDAQVYHERGRVYLLLARFDQARADFERASAIEPSNAEYQYALATFFDLPLGAFHDGPRSLYHARRTVDLRPADAEAREVLASAYLRAGQMNEGVAELRKGAELARGTALERKLLAMTERALGNSRSAVTYLQQACELPTSDPWIYYYLAEAHLALGEDTEALAAANRGLELFLRPSNEPVSGAQARDSWRGMKTTESPSLTLACLYRLRAQIHMSQKQYAAALADYSKYFEITANHPYQWYLYKRRALAHFHLGHYQEALADIEGIETAGRQRGGFEQLPHCRARPDI